MPGGGGGGRWSGWDIKVAKCERTMEVGSAEMSHLQKSGGGSGQNGGSG